METFLYSISGIIIGGIITFWASKYFFEKSLKSKKLSCFIQNISEILTDIDLDVKDYLRINFNSFLYQQSFQSMASFYAI